MAMFSLPKDKHAVVISPSIVVFTVALLSLLYFLFLVKEIILILFLAFIIMTALHPSVNTLKKRFKIPRVLGIVIVYIVALTSLSLLLAFILPPMGRELYQLVRTIELPFLQDEIKDLRFTVQELSALAERVGSSVGVIFSIINSTFSSLITFFTLIVISFYLLLDRPNLHKKISWFSKKERHIKMAENFIDEVEKQLGGWIRGQIILMIIIGIITYAGLVFLGVPYALPLAFIAGLLEILPNIGPTVAAIPAIILAFFGGGFVSAGVVTLYYVVIQQLENNIIVPKIMEKNADVNPLISIVAILTGFKLFSVAGALLAVPAYIVIRSLYSFWYHKRA